MNVGIPGTGLGGLFYAVSIIFIFFLEIIRFALGRGDKARLRFVGAQAWMLSGVIAALILADVFLEKVFSMDENPIMALVPGGKSAVLAGADAFALSTTLIASGVLAFLYVSVHIMRAFVYAYDWISDKDDK